MPNNLAWKLAGVVHRALEPTALDSYELERKPHARAMITTAIGIGLAMTGGGAVGEALRGLVFPRAHLVPGLRRVIVESVSPRLRRSSLSARRRPLRPSALVGTLAPNALLGTGERLDSVADGYILVTRSAPTPSLEAEMTRRRIGTRGDGRRRAARCLAAPGRRGRRRGSPGLHRRNRREATQHGLWRTSRASRRMRTVANRAQAQRCGRRRPVDTVAGADDHRVQYSSELMTADTKGREGGASPGSVNRLDRRKARTRAALIEAAQALLAEGRTNAPVQRHHGSR